MTTEASGGKGLRSVRVAALVQGVAGGAGLDPRYAAFFDCFNRGLYFEAHEVLEALWLTERGGADGRFYQGLIQVAGAFVHLRKQRLRPADALLALAERNLEGYGASHHRLDVAGVRRWIAEWRGALASGSVAVNPLEGRSAPKLELSCGAGPTD